MSHSLPAIRRDFSAADEQDALKRAYVPEHIPGLMRRISQGMPFLVGEYLGFASKNWLILVGYPLDGRFTPAGCESAFAQARLAYEPEYLWFIGPELPASLLETCRNRSSDQYYRLELEGFQPKASLLRQVNQAAEVLTVEQETGFRREHRLLVAEFLRRRQLPDLVAELYRSMPQYLAGAREACVLSARDPRGRLNAFYVVEQAARDFDAYVLGCFSRKHYIPHASDLLFSAMIDLARTHGKTSIQLGLGVNDGIRRFKEKWGGVPFLPYETCECHFGPAKADSILDLLLEGRW